jgi:hypothetical protein
LIALVAAFVASAGTAHCGIDLASGRWDTGMPPPPLAPAPTAEAAEARALAHQIVDAFEAKFDREARLNLAREDPFGEEIPVTPMTPYEWGKLLLNYTLLPIAWVRMGLFIPLFLTCCALAKLSIIGLDLHEGNGYGMAHGPQAEPWRRAVKRSMRYVIRVALFVAGFHHIEVTGRRAEAVEAPIVVSNHISLIDACLLFMLYEGPMFISKVSCGLLLVDALFFYRTTLRSHSLPLPFSIPIFTEVRHGGPRTQLGLEGVWRRLGRPQGAYFARRHAAGDYAPRSLQRQHPPPTFRPWYVSLIALHLSCFNFH